MHPLAWMAWIALVMAIALTASNPLYLAIVLLAVILVAVLAPKTSTGVAGFRTLLIFGTSLFVMSLGVALINGNYGTHVLFTIPGPEMPSWLGGLRIGGPVAAEGLVAAAIRGLAILCVLLAFGVFNGAVSPHRVLRTAPAALFHAGLVVTVGLTLLPATVDDVRRIREMRALRGGGSGLRSLPSLVVPAVIGGLERSMRLAEAMEARGYGVGPPASRAPRLIGALSAPLLLAAVSLWFYYPSMRPIAAILGLGGIAAIAWWVLQSAHSRHTTRLETEPMPRTDGVLAVGSMALALFAVAASSAGMLSLGYSPFAGLNWPSFELSGSLVALATAWPAVRLAFEPANERQYRVQRSVAAEHAADVVRP
jgi:energy-coupling factor transport system permease protein